MQQSGLPYLRWRSAPSDVLLRAAEPQRYSDTLSKVPLCFTRRCKWPDRCSISRCAHLWLLCQLGAFLKQSPLPWCSPFPVVEGTEERVGVFVAQEISSFVQFPRRVEDRKS